jgi:hypothetical protein
MPESGPYTRLVAILIRPSKYDDEGYVIPHFRGTLPSNTLSCLNSLTEDAVRRGALEGLDVRVEIIDASTGPALRRLDDSSESGAPTRWRHDPHHLTRDCDEAVSSGGDRNCRRDSDASSDRHQPPRGHRLSALGASKPSRGDHRLSGGRPVARPLAAAARLIRSKPRTSFSLFAKRPLQPIVAEELDGMRRPDRTVPAHQVVGGAVLVTTPADAIRLRRVQGNARFRFLGELTHRRHASPLDPVDARTAHGLARTRPLAFDTVGVPPLTQ